VSEEKTGGELIVEGVAALEKKEEKINSTATCGL